MCRVVSTALSCDIRSAGQARAWTERWLGSWTIEDDDGATTLLVSELVTNAVAHARTTSVLTLAVADGMIEVGVTENGPSPQTIPTQREIVVAGIPQVLRESGRGLMIVEALSHDWGVSAEGIGKQVWFRLPVAAQWPYTAACACSTDSPDAHRLPSGHGAVAVPGPWDRLPG
jgi:anti-sigma regulatory factor (Ser/Thr protein kinase)